MTCPASLGNSISFSNTSSLHAKKSSHIDISVSIDNINIRERKDEHTHSDSLISIINVDSVFLPWYGGFRMPAWRLTFQDCRLSCCYDHICRVLSEVVTQNCSKTGRRRRIVTAWQHIIHMDKYSKLMVKEACDCSHNGVKLEAVVLKDC